jgi:putative membrane protein
MNSEPHHLHPAAMLIDAIRTIRRWVSAFVIPGIALLASRGFSTQTIALVLLGALVAVALAGLWGFLSWRATTYEVSGGTFRLRQGVLQKNERTIPLEHVQSVDTVQGIIQRLFGIVEVRIETAGGGASEPDASLSALDRAGAEALRREIEGARREGPVEAEEVAGPAVIRRLETRDLLIAGATSGQIGVAFSLVAVVSQLFDDLLPESFAQRLIEALAPRSVGTALLLVLAVGVFAWLLAIGGTVLAYAGFTLSRDGDFLYIKRGLLERREATIPLARIQAVRIVEGVLRQPFGLASLRVESAGYGEASGVSTTLFPLLPRDEAEKLLLEAAAEFAVAPTLERLPARALRRYVFRSVVPVLLLAAAVALALPLAFDFATWGFLAALLLAIPAAFYGWLRYRDAGWAYRGDLLVVRSRLLARTTAIAPRRRLQSREVNRSPFQRRARLATFRAQVASGGGGAELRVTDLGSDVAEALTEGLGPTARRGRR